MGGTRHGLNATNHSVYRLVDINKFFIFGQFFTYPFLVRASVPRTRKPPNMEAKRSDLGKMR